MGRSGFSLRPPVSLPSAAQTLTMGTKKGSEGGFNPSRTWSGLPGLIWTHQDLAEYLPILFFANQLIQLSQIF